MVNYACGFNQSEMGKYFEWKINDVIRSAREMPCDQEAPMDRTGGWLVNIMWEQAREMVRLQGKVPGCSAG